MYKRNIYNLMFLLSSLGIMVNYAYNMETTAKNRNIYEVDGHITIHDNVSKLLKCDPKALCNKSGTSKANKY